MLACDLAQRIHELIAEQFTLSSDGAQANLLPAGLERDLTWERLNSRLNALATRQRHLVRDLPQLEDEPECVNGALLVWRIEHPETGEGPYVRDTSDPRSIGKRSPRGQLSYYLRQLHQRCESRPGVREEFPQFSRACVPHSACTSLADLERWFCGAWGHLAAAGYEVRCYAAPARDCWVGASGQVAFYRSLALLVKSRPMLPEPGDQIAA